MAKKNLFKNSFVITMPTRPDKLSAFMSRAEAAGITGVKPFRAVVPPKGVAGLNPGLGNRPGAFGCYLSHRSIISMALAEDLPFVVVFEEDATFAEGFKDKVGELYKKLPNDWDMFFMGSLEVFDQEKVCEGMGKGSLAYGAHCYMVRKDAYLRILDLLDSYETAVDDLYTSVKFGLRCYYAIPSLSGQFAGTSDIDGGFKSYPETTEDFREDQGKSFSGLPVVHVFGVGGLSLSTGAPVPEDEKRLETHCHMDDSGALELFSKNPPSAIVTFGDPGDFPVLSYSPFSVRSLWINKEDTRNLSNTGNAAFMCMMNNVVSRRKGSIPLVSVFTCACNCGEIIERPYNSLKKQIYREWEWVIYDDSDDGKTSELINGMASRDYRIKVVRSHARTGNVGMNKLRACKASSGDILLELDHDDELTPDSILNIVKAFEQYPDAGFAYTDFAECNEDMSPVFYGDKPLERKPPDGGWGFGYGSYRLEKIGDVSYYVSNAPDINSKTIRHIVGAPNHARCWRRDVYFKIGGHSELLAVADDYELLVRTFLATRMVRVPSLGYIQYRNAAMGNTHQHRLKNIQRIVKWVSGLMEERIHERFVELGIPDPAWEKGSPWARDPSRWHDRLDLVPANYTSTLE